MSISKKTAKFLVFNPFEMEKRDYLVLGTLFQVFQNRIGHFFSLAHEFDDEIFNDAIEIMYAQIYQVSKTNDPHKFERLLRVLDDMKLKTLTLVLQQKNEEETTIDETEQLINKSQQQRGQQ